MFNAIPKPVLFGLLGILGGLIGWGLGEPAISALKAKAVNAPDAPTVATAPSLLFPPEVQKRLVAANAHTGKIEISLDWQSYTDLDLHCVDPQGTEICFKNMKAPSGGWLDVDCNVSTFTRTPVEHIVWQTNPPPGRYEVFVVHYALHGDPDPTPYRVIIKTDEGLNTYQGQLISSGDPNIHRASERYVFQVSAPAPPAPPAVAGPDYRGAILFGVWGALLAIPLGLALLFGQNEVMHRPRFEARAMATVILGGLAAGFVSGVVIQLLYGYLAQQGGVSGSYKMLGFGLGWGLLGAFLGITVGLFIPNVPKHLTGLGGFIGGAIGGVIVAKAMNEVAAANLMYAHGLGAVSLGAGVGVLLVVAEIAGREAALIVHWGAHERSLVNLSAVPAVLGSAPKAALYLPVEKGFPAVAALVSFANGKVTMENRLTNSSHTLRNGNKLKLGELIVEVMVK